MGNDRRLRIDQEFKFTEEIINIYEQREELYKFDIGYQQSKKCNISRTNPSIGDSTICKKCYYSDFIKKMDEVRKSKRSDFLQYQMDLRNDPKTWLKELSELLEDQEDYFDGFDYSFAYEYQTLTEQKMSQLDEEQEVVESNTPINVKAILSQEIENIKAKEEGMISNDNIKIFITHSSKNANYGNAIVDLLTGVGIHSDQIIFTSNTAFGIPNGKNIFDWLKNRIKEKPHVIYLLSPEYYKSVACLNEMGAAWVVENEHTMIFTPEFKLDSPEFQNGALDPREIGFYIDNEERLTAFIESLKESFSVTTSIVLVNQKINEFIKRINPYKEKTKPRG
jgi:hypothetical protein